MPDPEGLVGTVASPGRPGAAGAPAPSGAQCSDVEQPDPEHHRELGRFLRERRARLTPEALGLPPGKRRRTPGLRREEVAQLAHISTTWYTWLEQGRGARPSLQVLEAVSRALRLSHDEHEHVLALCAYTDGADADGPTARHAANGISGAGRSARPVPPAVRAILDALLPVPAYVLSPRYDVLAWNEAQRSFLADFARLPAAERNVVWLMFHHPGVRRRYLDWDAEADALVAEFRAATVRHVERPVVAQLLERLNASSAEFRDRWAQHDAPVVARRIKRCRHPIAGRIDIEPVHLKVIGRADLRLVAFTPADPASAARLPLLLRSRPQPAAALASAHPRTVRDAARARAS